MIFWIRSGLIEANRWFLRADSGFYLTDKSGEAYSNVTGGRWLNTSTGAHLTSTGIWANNSDKNLKENFSTINGQDILRKIGQLPITQWNYKIDDDNVIHIGPMAQDFYSVFGVGYDDKSIAALDEAGIALAAIQELHKKTQKIDKLETELADLRKLVDELLERDNSDTGGRR